jgi:hypothetical protein
MPLQVKHMNTPRFTLAQVGLRVPQSAHVLLPSNFKTAASMRRWRSFCSKLTSLLLFMLLLEDSAVLAANSCNKEATFKSLSVSIFYQGTLYHTDGTVTCSGYVTGVF